jgi:hypothetical protein
VGGRLAVALAIIVFLAVLAGLGAISGNLTFFATKDHPELAAEGRYRKVISRDFGALEPLNAALDACNIGGTRQGCYDASNKMIDALNSLLRDLNTTYVPSRYVDGNDAVRHAVQRLLDGFQTRNSGLAANDNASFVRGNDELKQGNSDLRRAWRHFPADARPVPLS